MKAIMRKNRLPTDGRRVRMRPFNKLLILILLLMTASLSWGQAVRDVEAMREAMRMHNKAIHPMDDWMRDPYITIGPDGYYYLTATHLTDDSQIAAPLWKSSDLINWEQIGFPYSIAMASNYAEYQARLAQRNKDAIAAGKEPQTVKLWAPEFHFIKGKWVVVHTSNTGLGNLAISRGAELKGPWVDWGTQFQRHHDPTLFQDDDGAVYMLARCAEVGKLKEDLSGYAWGPELINPADRKMGHEGVCMVKVGGKYVLFGTAWSRDKLRKGTYNLYYATADSIEGPYGPRKFAGRFLGHGTVFKDKEGRWWCTAFYNANHPPLDPVDAKTKDLSDSAYTINQQGLTLVPMEIKLVDGEVTVRAKDPDYRFPGPEEMQQF